MVGHTILCVIMNSQAGMPDLPSNEKIMVGHTFLCVIMDCLSFLHVFFNAHTGEHAPKRSDCSSLLRHP